jgi:protein-disulfide isomerase
MNRRSALLFLGGVLTTGGARAAGVSLYPLKSDAGAPLTNERVPSDLDPSNLPGAVFAGSRTPDVILVEFFDYNCGFCRGAVHQIDAAVHNDADLQLRLYNNAILAPGSVEAAKVQQAVLRAHGPNVAYEFHKNLLSIHGPANLDTAMDVADGMSLEMDLVRQGVDLPRVASVVAAQMAAAKTLDLTATPSFLVDGVEVLGWPGPATLASIVRSVRACDRPVCKSGVPS